MLTLWHILSKPFSRCSVTGFQSSINGSHPVFIFICYIYICMSLYCIILHSFGIANIHWLRWFSSFTLNKEFDLMCSSPHFHRDFAIPNMLGIPIHDGEMTIPHWLTMATHLVKLGVTPPFSGIPHLISLVIILCIYDKKTVSSMIIH